METSALETVLVLVAVPSLILALVEIARVRARERFAHDEARTDGMTGIGNKRRWVERMSELQERRQPFAFILFDLANLKAANAVLGHLAADELLVRVAEQVRHGDRVGSRIGGDEFAIELPGASHADAVEICQRIELAVGDIGIAPGVGAFVAGAAGEWIPGQDLAATMTEVDFELERNKAHRKSSLGMPATRDETLAALSSLALA